MTRRGLLLALLTAAALALVPTAFAVGGSALPRAVSSYLLGPKLIRAEIAVKGGQSVRGFWVDRGKLLKRYSAGSLSLLERSGATVTVPVSASARVTLNGRLVTVRALRAGMQIAVAHQDTAAATAVYASSARAAAPKLPVSLSTTLLGTRLIRGEIAVKDTAVHDYRLDRGRITQVGVTTLTIHEADGTDVTVNVSPTARVKVNGQNAIFVQLRRGMMAITMHDGDKPADQIYATGKLK
jgi:hypothetical protein